MCRSRCPPRKADICRNHGAPLGEVLAAFLRTALASGIPFTVNDCMAKRLHLPDFVSARMPPGTERAMEAALREGETMADFVRAAIAAELERRKGE